MRVRSEEEFSRGFNFETDEKVRIEEISRGKMEYWNTLHGLLEITSYRYANHRDAHDNTRSFLLARRKKKLPGHYKKRKHDPAGRLEEDLARVIRADVCPSAALVPATASD